MFKVISISFSAKLDYKTVIVFIDLKNQSTSVKLGFMDTCHLLWNILQYYLFVLWIFAVCPTQAESERVIVLL